MDGISLKFILHDDKWPPTDQQAKMSSNSIRADCDMKHFLIHKDEQLQLETRSREYCYDDRLRSCRHCCLWTFQKNSYVSLLLPSLKNSCTCFWGLQVERNIPASGVRNVSAAICFLRSAHNYFISDTWERNARHFGGRTKKTDRHRFL